MNQPSPLAFDLTEEFRLRRWARLNYCPPDERQRDLHPIVQDEMRLRDAELARLATMDSWTSSIVPLFEGPHSQLSGPHYADRAGIETFETLGQSELYYS